MKKVLKVLMLVTIMLIVYQVKAANYTIKELIPVNIKTTIVTNNFSYKDFYYNEETNSVDFTNIKNLTDKELPISISIALFGANKRNISIINHCSPEERLGSKEEKTYAIGVTSEDLPDDKNIKNVRYIAILGDNINCRTSGNGEFVDQTIKEIGMVKNKALDEQTELLLQILTVIGIILITLFLYKLLFTTTYQNKDGNSVRRDYKKYNKKLQKEREEELRRNPPKAKEPKKIKTDEVLKQEEQAKNENKDETDLHNLYK